MMNRRFSGRERLLLLVLIILFTATLYVMAIYNPTTTSINAARNEYAMLESSLEYELLKAEELARMRTSLKDMEDSGVEFEMIPLYDNISNVAPLLNAAFAKANEFDLRFSPITFADNFAIREIMMVFSAENYIVAADIIEELLNGPYSCDIRVLDIVSTDEESSSITSGTVGVSLKITFYEVHRPDMSGDAYYDEYADEYGEYGDSY